MNMKDFALGVVTGVAAAIVVKEMSERVSPYASPNNILNSIKDEFRKQAPIDGSWIYMKTENFSNGFTETPVYRGGISRTLDGEIENYEFAADARSGAIIDIQQV
ncbi:hypothetical protein DCE79_13595 [Lysinibacillus sp. 2017]|uniref:PepSY domain-containing protein n=1 Tax=unclassified Lysinibacillus TaxID=2636778 RepID=UPI000D525F4B|nr:MULTISPECIES: PepSY domain-containing protein [unclassified Lysinibacillus]AWE08371.1 hypothetical protein DCE79_13595 [Lysinibacillus sp. 2017]TGN35780.1 hypothetical protein E4L99_07960 [Lysinibacillus sp. S2017]